MSDYATACVLSYERPVFLRECLSTLLAHAGAPLELIIHDDGSEDPEVYHLLDEFRRSGMASSIITNAPGHNQGQGTALNRMFSMATGDPIIKLDQDLVFAPDWLHKTQRILNANIWNDGVDCDDPMIGLLGLFHYHHEPCDSAKTIMRQYDGWSTRTHILGSGFAVRRRCFEQLGPFEEHSSAFAEDWVFQRKVTEHSDWVCALPNDDLVINQGFGIGPSTVVIAPGTVHPIHDTPKLVHA